MNPETLARFELAQLALKMMPSAERSQLDALIKRKLMEQISDGALPVASGYHVVLVLDDSDVIHLAVELTDAARQLLAGPFSIGPLDVQTMEGFRTLPASSLLSRLNPSKGWFHAPQ